MPRIPDEQIQRLKKEVSLVRLCERYNIDLIPGQESGGILPLAQRGQALFYRNPEQEPVALHGCMRSGRGRVLPGDESRERLAPAGSRDPA